jgi:hypothetical protein
VGNSHLVLDILVHATLHLVLAKTSTHIARINSFAKAIGKPNEFGIRYSLGAQQFRAYTAQRYLSVCVLSL